MARTKTQASYNNGKHASILKAAEFFCIPYHTLRNRIKGYHASHEEAGIKRQKLTPAQEEVLAEWVRWKATEADPLKPKQVLAEAQLIGGLKNQPTMKWLRAFIERHHLQLGRPSGLDPKRASSFNKPAITGFFKEYKGLLEAKGYKAVNTYNMDEKGIQLGGGRNSGPS
jgi:transposase